MILDSSAALAIPFRDPDARRHADAIAGAASSCRMSAANALEASMVVESWGSAGATVFRTWQRCRQSAKTRLWPSARSCSSAFVAAQRVVAVERRPAVEVGGGHPRLSRARRRRATAGPCGAFTERAKRLGLGARGALESGSDACWSDTRFLPLRSDLTVERIFGS